MLEYEFTPRPEKQFVLFDIPARESVESVFVAISKWYGTLGHVAPEDLMRRLKEAEFQNWFRLGDGGNKTFMVPNPNFDREAQRRAWDVQRALLRPADPKPRKRNA